jgi:site-specific recombinase XerD
MVNAFFMESRALQRVYFGPLGSRMDRFAALLLERGYARQTGKSHLRIVAEFSKWLYQQKLGVKDLDEQRVVQFLRYKQRRSRVFPGNAEALRILAAMSGAGAWRILSCRASR